MREDVETALREALLASERGADLIEFRLDHLFDPEAFEAGVREASALCERSPVPSIVTCRPVSEGGEFEGDDESRLKLFGALLDAPHPPRYIDLEIETIKRSPLVCVELLERLAEGGEETSLIVSTHDFEGRPGNLLNTVMDMRAVEAARVIKLAYRARSLRDNLELFELLEHRDRPTIALGMGEFGLASRVLAPKFGGFVTFASVSDTSATAPGQPTLDEILTRYRFREIGGATRVFGVIGWPVAHSDSPRIHNASFEHFGIDGVYLPMPVPGDWEHFKATVPELIEDPRLGVGGMSVTIPHKAHAVRLARELNWAIDPSAARAGASNTIVVDEQRNVRVTNTDGRAARACLEGDFDGSLDGARVAVIGAGGVARGIVAALVDTGARIVVFNRTVDRARELADDMRTHASDGTTIEARPLDELSDAAHDVYINATSLGMSGGGAENESPVDEQVAKTLPDSALFMDTVYTPVDTPFLRLGREHGLQTIDGRAMFLRQAALQFEAWTGVKDSLGFFENPGFETA